LDNRSVENVVADLVERLERRFYGKYRALVVDNADPEQLGRLKLRIPSVLGSTVVSGWALPCVPYGGDLNQGLFCIPEVGAGVWVEFEEGDLESPIWVGTFWSKPGGESEVPKPNDPDGAEQGSVQDPPTRKILKTAKGHTIQLEDADGEEMVLLFEATHGHVLVMNADGIKITDGENGHEVTLDSSGLTVADGVNSGNKVVMAGTGVTIEDANGNQVVMGPSGIQVGSSSASEFFVLGTQFMLEVTNFMVALATHTHVGNMGAPTSPPTAPIQLNVPLSAKNTVE
jgi:uncharacterized protein involved in type VI secretion and phage assembly